MKRKTAYFFMLLLPLIIPYFLFYISLVFKHESLITGLFAGQMVFAEKPYIVFMIGVLAWTWNKSAQTISEISWGFPFCFVPCLYGSLLLEQLYRHKQFDFYLQTAGWISILTLFFGYFYVILAHLIIKLLDHFGLIKETPA